MQFRSLNWLVVVLFHCPIASAERAEEAVENYLQVSRDSGIAAVGELIHPESLHAYRELFEPMIESALKSDEAGSAPALADPKDPTTLRPMDDLEFYQSVAKANESMLKRVEDLAKGARFQIVGHVVEGDFTHVVVRIIATMRGLESAKIEVVSVKDYEGLPKIILNGIPTLSPEAVKNE